jgi:hypothetical protein
MIKKCRNQGIPGIKINKRRHRNRLGSQRESIIISSDNSIPLTTRIPSTPTTTLYPNLRRSVPARTVPAIQFLDGRVRYTREEV